MTMKIYNQTLDDVARELIAASKDHARGFLVIAKKVITLASNWEPYKKEAGGLDCSSWLRGLLGERCGVEFFDARLRGIEAIGSSALRTWSDEAVVWVGSRKWSEADRRRFVKESEGDRVGRVGANGPPISHANAVRVAKKLKLYKSQHHTKVCANCTKLLDEVERLRAALAAAAPVAAE